MADLPGEVRADARLIVERMRAARPVASASYPRAWLPQGTFDDLLEHADREPIHFHPSIHHLHQHWDMGPARRHDGTGRGPKAIARRILARIIGAALEGYFVEEQEFRAALAQSIDAIAYRVDEIAGADERAMLDLVRSELLDLARFVEARVDAGPGAR